MKKLLIALLLVNGAGSCTRTMAETVPSTFDDGCFINWTNGGCGVIANIGGEKPKEEASVEVSTPTPPDPHCDPKDPPDDTDGDDGDQDGRETSKRK